MSGYLDFVNNSRTEISGWTYLTTDNTFPTIVTRLHGHQLGQPFFSESREDVADSETRATCSFKITFETPLPAIAIVAGLLEIVTVDAKGAETPIPISPGCSSREKQMIAASLRDQRTASGTSRDDATTPSHASPGLTAPGATWVDLELAKYELTKQLSNIPTLVSQALKPLIDASSHKLVIAGIRQTRQLEAILQLAPYVPATSELMPATGGFALDARSLLHLMKTVDAHRPRNVLEFGSGTSTVWLGHLLRTYGARLRSLEHSEEFYEVTLAELVRHDLLETVDLRLAPLEQVQGLQTQHHWYSMGQYQDFHSVDIAIIDGPPEDTTTMARYPGYPAVRHQLSDHAMVMLHDIDRTDETAIVEQWLTEYPELTLRDAHSSNFAVLEHTL